jgi:hypothetical protein
MTRSRGKFKISFIITGLFVIFSSLMVVGCAGGSAATPAAPTAMIDTADELMTALQAEGMKVEDAGMSEPFMLERRAHLLNVNDQQVSVWEYETVDEANNARLFLTGPNSPLALMDFIAAPRFYQSGSMIVLFVATDEAVVSTLTKVLGEPFL